MRLPHILILLVVVACGCNVFYGVNSVDLTEPSPNADAGTNTNTGNTNGTTTMMPDPDPVCTDSCTCDRDCSVDCSDCDIACKRDVACTGAVSGNSTASCAEDAECRMGCTGGTCEFTCLDRDSKCFVDCSGGADCLLNCGDKRNPPRIPNCVFTNCDAPQTCGNGVFVCNRDCP